MKIYKYENYDEYVKAQVDANHRKISKVWAEKPVLENLRKHKRAAKVILCHGTRNGKEQQFFREIYPDVEQVVGTEISDTANQFPDTIQHDFHKDIPDLVGKCDLIYSNSFDHSYDPEMCLGVWHRHLTNNGVLALEIMVGGENKSKLSDPLEISEEEVKELADNLGMTFKKSYEGVKDCSKLLVFGR